MSEVSLVLVMGVPGSGKTSLARRVVEQVHWTYLDNNFIVDPFFAETRNAEQYSALRPTLYEVLYNVTVHNLSVGNTVLLDVPHVKQMQDPAWRERMHSIALSATATLKVIRCYCSEFTLKQRLRTRGEKRDIWKLDNWKEFLKQEPLRAPIPMAHLEINTELEDYTAAAQRVLIYVAANDVAGLPLKSR
jgi:predicted kinase